MIHQPVTGRACLNRPSFRRIAESICSVILNPGIHRDDEKYRNQRFLRGIDHV